MKVSIADIRKLVREALEGFDDEKLARLDVAHSRVGDFKTASFNALPALENLELAIDELLAGAAEGEEWIVPVPVEQVTSLKGSLADLQDKLFAVKQAVESQKI